MPEGESVPATAVINLLLNAVIINVFLMALAFGAIAGLATVMDANRIASVFTPVSGALVVLAGFLSAIHSLLIDLLEDLAL